MSPRDDSGLTGIAVGQCLMRDQKQLFLLLSKIKRRKKSDQPYDRLLQQFEKLLQKSRQIVDRRRQLACTINYPDTLPVSQRRDEIASALEQHQVIVVAGETGSGKTTQLPKICLDAGRGLIGRIGHTQPRRIAARSVAQRLCDEMSCQMGEAVGFQVRFQEHINSHTRIKLMTDGILLSEIQSDRDLLQYDTLILDEAHERSLNIDFLLGYLKQLLQRRPDLKLIVTSATIATEKFSSFFNQAPVIEVSGRSYPVDVIYQPLQSDDLDEADLQMQDGIVAAVGELSRRGDGDVLVFLSGEREIRETAELLRKQHPPNTEILPLYSRLSVAEQNRIFQAHKKRRVVLATNVAETSLTVPGIRYVVDPGFARISRYSYRSKVQRLPIEKISQAAANQRKGRCGRVAPGVCIRLYDEQDFGQRAEFTEPEIQRTNLASVILQMKVLGLGDVAEFPFMDPPDRRFINDGYRLLFELGAVDKDRQLTDLGHKLARLPIDPRLARMILQAQQNACLHEALVIATALEVQDPRDRPMDAQQKADEQHKAFVDDSSDFRTLLNIWDFYHEQARHISRNQLRKLCHERFLSHRRMGEWHDLHQQLANLLKESGVKFNKQPADNESLHIALLSGLVSHIGFLGNQGEYLGSHNKHFLIFPGSGLARKKPKWIMAAEIVETSRMYARMVAVIKPEWVEQVAPQLIKYSYSEPHWQARRGQVTAREKLSLYGLSLLSNRRVNYGRIDPSVSRELFIRSALVQGEYRSKAEFFMHNQDIQQQAQTLEDKSRRRDVQQDEQVMYDFYDQHIPEGVYSQPAFEKWLKQAEKQNPRLLYVDLEMLLRDDIREKTAADYPDHLLVNNIPIKLQYQFNPGDSHDGVSAIVPLAILNQLLPQTFDWLVPGLLEDKLIHLIKSLPKALRRNFVPAPEYARACMDVLHQGKEPLLQQLSNTLKKITGVEIGEAQWQEEKLPDYLRMHFIVQDQAGKQVASGRNLQTLQAELSEQARSSFSSQVNVVVDDRQEQEVVRWDFGELKESVEVEQHGMKVQAFPALQEENDKIRHVMLETLPLAEAESRRAMVYLFMHEHARDVNYLRKNLKGVDKSCLHYRKLADCDELKDDILFVVVYKAMDMDAPLIRTELEFSKRSEQASHALVSIANELSDRIANIMNLYHDISKNIKSSLNPAWLKAVTDMRQQLDDLVFRGFVRQVPYEQLTHYQRYLQALQLRMKKLEQNPARDQRLLQELKPALDVYQERLQLDPTAMQSNQALQHYHWMLEEFRVSLFAQELKTAMPVSAKRLREYWKKEVIS